MKNVAIIGAGGHARVIADMLVRQASERDDLGFVGFIAPQNPTPPDHRLPPILGTDEDVPTLVKSGKVSHFVVGVGSVRGGQGIRSRIYDAYLDLGVEPITVIDPSAFISEFAVIENGTVVMPMCAINAGTILAQNSIINTGARIDHDCSIGRHTHIAPGVTLSGDVDVGNDTLIGTGATCIQGVKVGHQSTVGAGAVVVDAVPDGTTVVGCPARPR